jgi:hypothetical protein
MRGRLILEPPVKVEHLELGMTPVSERSPARKNPQAPAVDYRVEPNRPNNFAAKATSLALLI